MATGVSSKNNVNATIDTTYSNDIRIWEVKLTEPVPQSKNPLHQDDLNQIHTLYLQGIKAHIDTARALAGIEVALYTVYNEGLAAIGTSMAPIKKQQRALLSLYDHCGAEINNLKDRIVELVNTA